MALDYAEVISGWAYATQKLGNLGTLNDVLASEVTKCWWAPEPYCIVEPHPALSERVLEFKWF